MSVDEIILGIDLGTTFSVAAYVDDLWPDGTGVDG